MKYIKIAILITVFVSQIFADVRIKDISRVENTDQESLIGYGLVIGLSGTGDRTSGTRGAVFTVQTISNMLERFGINVPKDELRTRNVAAVMVTASTPLYGRIGTHFDITVSSLGDATSLEGGILLMTPLTSENGTPWAMAQGPVSIGGYNIETQAGEHLRKNHALVGRVPGGAQLKRAVDNNEFNVDEPVRLLLNNPDFVTATRVATSINDMWVSGNNADASQNSDKLANPVNAAVIEIGFPDFVQSLGDASFFIASIETLSVKTDVDARVVINERTGTIVAGGKVLIDEVMISHGNLTIHTERTPIISQPTAPFSNAGRTVVDQITNTTAVEDAPNTGVLPSTATVTDLASALNEMGLKPRDIIAIFQSIKQAGALNAKLIIL